MTPMGQTQDKEIAAVFTRRVSEARAYLRREMEAHGLREADGWRISESVRQVDGGCELVLRPIHMTQIAPADLECVVHIDEEAAAIDSSC